MKPADHETEGTSIIYTTSNRGKANYFRPPFWASNYTREQFRYRSVGGNVPVGYWWNEIAWPYNTITDGENITHEGQGEYSANLFSRKAVDIIQDSARGRDKNKPLFLYLSFQSIHKPIQVS